MVPVFISSLLVFAFIMLGTRMLSIMELVVSQGVAPAHVLKLVAFLLPSILFYALPAAALMASLIAFIRLSSDSEIIALKSSGISLYQLLPSVVVLAVAASIAANAVAFVGVPWGNRSVKELILRIAQSKAAVGLKERVFCHPFDDVIFYINSLSPGRQLMKDVFVVDRREPAMTYTILAKTGQILLHPKANRIVVHFEDGTIFMADQDLESMRTVDFSSYDLKVGLEDIVAHMGSQDTEPKEMGMAQLLKKIRGSGGMSGNRNELMVELMERLTIPFGVFLLAIIGVPLGTHMKTRAFSLGIGVSLVVFLLYYMLYLGVRSLCETGTLAPAWGMWIPNGFLLATCVYLLQRVANEKPLPLSAESFMRSKLREVFTREPETQERPVVLTVQESLFPRPEKIKEPEKGIQPPAAETAEAEESPSLEPSSRKEAAVVEDDERPYVGNIRQKRYHRSDCAWVKRLSPQNTCFFRSKAEAEEQDYVPCRVCRP